MSAPFLVPSKSEHVPETLWGVWRRERLDVGGWSDTTTAVYWLQTRKAFVDIRVPPQRRRASWPSTLDGCDAETLTLLATTEGVAGALDVAGGLCSWKRAIDIHQAALPDEGRIAWRDPDTRLETGMHAPFTEVWRREPAGRGPVAEFALTEDPQGRAGVLAVAGERFSVAVERPKTSARDAARAQLDLMLAHGALADWRVELSVWPWLEGRSLWQDVEFSTGDDLQLRTGDQIWTLRDASVAPAALRDRFGA